MLKGQNIFLKRGPRQILAGITFQLEPGKVTAVLGPNGAGKTALLRILSGEWEPAAGSVEINTIPIRDIPVRRLGQIRAYLHQESTLDLSGLRRSA